MTQKHIMRFEVIMDAGNGAQKAGDILIKTLAKSGRYVFIEPIIPAEISPPKRTPHSMSGAIIRVADFEISNIGSTTDLMLFEHEILLDRRLDDKDYEENSVVLLDMAEEKRAKDGYAAAIKKATDLGLRVVPFHMDDDSLLHLKELNGNGKNMYYMGMLASIYSISKDEMVDAIRATFKKLSDEKLNKNVAIFENGYKNVSDVFSDTYEIASAVEEKTVGEKILLDGNTALSLGIIDSGFKLFSGYPITPASTIMHTLARQFASYGGIVHQAEDEIAAMGTVVGAYYAGVPALTATSGPGLSLKQEIIGLSMVAEVPSVIIDVQRGGPSTGLPTRTEQTDLFAAAFGSHGDGGKVVISVANVEDCFYAPHVARYLAEKLRAPIFILSDYLLSVSYKVLDKMISYQLENSEDISEAILNRFYMDKLPDDIEMVKANQAIPGEPDHMRRVTGLNTDQGGNIVYTSESNQRSHDIRNEKLHHVRRALRKPEIIGEETGDLLVIAWGSTRGVLEEAINIARKEGLSVSGLHLKIVYPLPLMLSELFSKFKKIITVEAAYGDAYKTTPLATMLRSETLVDVQNGLATASGRPLKPKAVLAKIRELV